MPRYAQDQLEKIKQETRASLVRSALAEFAQYGFEQANVNRISEKAGFAKGTVYNYFPSKQALMLALIEECGTEHVAWVSAAIRAEQDITRRLEAFFESGFSFVEQQPLQARFLLATLYSPGSEFRTAMGRVYMPLFGLIAAEILLPGMAEGVFRPLDPPQTASLLMTLYLGTASQVDEHNKTRLTALATADFAMRALHVSDGERR
jgi:AcrR family transcriptional regulator